MWVTYATADLFLISTNSTLCKDGALVMGRGIARQAKERFPGLDLALGTQIQTICSNPSASLRACAERSEVTGLGEYGLLISPRWPEAKLGAFQVKRHYSQPASLALIQFSTAALCVWCAKHPDAGVHLNFPGVGYGRLRREEVLSIIAQLPAQVTIWEYPPADT
jgi:hypothetical protein